MNTTSLKESWQQVSQHGDEVPLFFYSSLFIAHPETRAMFPVSMAGQRDRLVNALGRIVSDVDDVEALVPYLRQLGQDHRKYEVVAGHYSAVGSALLATLEYFLGPEWTPELRADWEAAYGLVAKVMIEAAEDAARTSPSWWQAVVIEHECRTLDLAVLRLRPDTVVPYLPGQSIAVEVPMRPRVWRFYSPANAPRSDGTFDLHVRLIGGPVSSALVQSVQPGDVLRLGAPVGDRLVLDAQSDRDLLLIGGGTGLAPLKALVEQLATENGTETVRRRASLFVGARTARELYDLPALQRLADQLPWLSVLAAVSEDPTYGGERGNVVDVALRNGRWTDHDVYVCGSDDMVDGTVRTLQSAGIVAGRIRYEGFGIDGPGTGSLDASALSTSKGGRS